MLQAISDRIKGWLGILIVLLIGLPFALWGIQSYLGNGAGPGYAAKVNSTKISMPEFEYAVSLQKQKLLQRFKGKLPITDKILRKQVLNQMINRRLLETTSYDEGYRISDPLLAARIRQLFSVKGKFDGADMKARLAAVGKTPQQFEGELRNELRIQEFQTAIVNSTIATKTEISKLARLERQLRDVSIITFNADKFAGNYKASEAEIKQYYDANKQQFMKPERVKVDYVEITGEGIGKKIHISEDKIKSMYADYLAGVKNREQRRTSHILITAGHDAKSRKAAKAKIIAIQKLLAKGEPFAELAKKYSQDPDSAKKGGNLGWISEGDMVKPFEDALYSLKKGQVSAIVKTRFGYHLIQLNGIRKQKPEPLSAERAGFETELRKEAVSDKFYDISEKLANKAYENPDSLDELVDTMHLKLHTSEYFTRSKGTGIASNEKIRSTAYSSEVLKQGLNSDVIQLSPTDIVVLRVNQHVAASAIPLAKVKSGIGAILETRAGYKKALATAMTVKKKIESGVAIDQLSMKGMKVDNPGKVSRTDYARVKDFSLLATIFKIPTPVGNKPAVREQDMTTGNVALIVLHKIFTPEKISKDKLNVIYNERRRQIALDEFSAVLKEIKSKAKININKRILH